MKYHTGLPGTRETKEELGIEKSREVIENAKINHRI